MRYVCPNCGETCDTRPPQGTCPKCGTVVRLESESTEGVPHQVDDGRPASGKKRL